MRAIRVTGLSRVPVLALLSCLFFLSCATQPGLPRLPSLGSMLGRDSPDFLRLSGQAGRNLPPELLEAALAGERARSTQQVPTREDRDWSREGSAWTNAKTGYVVTVPDSDLLLVASPSMNRLLSREGGIPEKPGNIVGQSAAAFLVWLPEPLLHFGLASSSLGRLLSELDLPLRGILLVGGLAASPAGDSEDPEISCDIVFLLDGPASARIYRPVLRMVWGYFAKSRLGLAASATTPDFIQEGGRVFASDLRIRASSLALLASG